MSHNHNSILIKMRMISYFIKYVCEDGQMNIIIQYQYTWIAAFNIMILKSVS